jgi:hypothetical protein
MRRFRLGQMVQASSIRIFWTTPAQASSVSSELNCRKRGNHERNIPTDSL